MYQGLLICYTLSMIKSENASCADNQQETHRQVGILRDYTSDIMNEKLVALIAFLFTDGGISRHGVDSWRIFFANSSLSAIGMFKELLVDIFKIPPTRIQVKQRQGHHYFVRLTSKQIGGFLVERFGTFRTLKFDSGLFPQTSLPIKWLENTGTIPLFLRVAFSMDGGVKFYPMRSARKGYEWLERGIDLACHHPVLRSQYCYLLEKLGIRPTNVEKDKVIKIRRRENLERFAEIVGFLDGVTVTRHSKFWIGKEKNEVMRLMLESYGQLISFLARPNFHSHDNDIVRTA